MARLARTLRVHMPRLPDTKTSAYICDHDACAFNAGEANLAQCSVAVALLSGSAPRARALSEPS